MERVERMIPISPTLSSLSVTGPTKLDLGKHRLFWAAKNDLFHIILNFMTGPRDVCFVEKKNGCLRMIFYVENMNN